MSEIAPLSVASIFTTCPGWSRRIALVAARMGIGHMRLRASTTSSTSIASDIAVPHPSDEDCDVGAARGGHERASAAEFDTIDEVIVVVPEGLDGHLAGDEADVHIFRRLQQGRDASDVVLGEAGL